MAENLEQKTGRSFLQKSTKWLGTALLAGYIGMFAACQSSTDPPPPPPPTKYKHAIKVEAEKTLHYGVPVTGGTFRVTMLNDLNTSADDVIYPPLSQDAATLGTETTAGTLLNLAETTKPTEPCTIIMYPKVNFDSDCLAREFREIGVTNTTLTAQNVIKLSDVDWAYLHTEVLTKKDNMGRSLNTSWEPRFLNASSNPDPLTGLRLETRYIEGQLYTIDGATKLYGIKPALLDFQEWGKRYVSTASEEAYITNAINFVDANNPATGTPLDGDYQAFRTTEISGVSNITYPITEVKVMSSKELVNQSSATPWRAHWEALGAIIAGSQAIGDPDRFKTCVPVMNWRPKGREESTHVYWIEGTIKESQKGVDNFSTTIQTFAQEFVHLEGASSYYNNIKFGADTSVDYTPGVTHWTTDHPLREAVENATTKGRIKRDSPRR
jgi:hypothetical protein